MTVKELRRYLRRLKGNSKVLVAIENFPGARYDNNIALEPIRLLVRDRDTGNLVIAASDNSEGILTGMEKLKKQPRG